MNKRFLIIGIILLFSAGIVAQNSRYIYEILRKSEIMMKEVERQSDSAWKIAYPIVQNEKAGGRPYIPWASRPYDLPQAEIPAFPGAEGGGKYSFGGRGGKVLVVTNTKDSGKGSLRWACEQGGARIVVFNVAGIIQLKTPIKVRAPYITIAGQTAPGDGVCVAGESFLIDTHDVIIRHMRFRRGTIHGRLDDCLGGNPVGNIMLDHISTSWGTDENLSIYRHMYNDGNGGAAQKLGTVNITIQNSISSEALDIWGASHGSTLGGENNTFIRNLWACNAGRNPSIGWYGIFNFVNNVIFNWWNRSVDGGDYRAMYNIINNYYKPGPCTPLDEPIAYRIIRTQSGRSKLPYRSYGLFYVDGNVVENFDEISKDNWNGGVQLEGDDRLEDYIDSIRWNKAFLMPEISIMSAQEAYAFVLNNAGATLPKRDAVDERIIKTVRTGIVHFEQDINPDSLPVFTSRRLPADSYKLGIIYDISQVGGYPEYKGEPYKDGDADGMPDKWEIKYGLNPDNASDANEDCNGDGYTNIEKFINGIDPSKTVDWKNPGNNVDVLSQTGRLNP